MSDADDITSETWWRREIVTTELDEACDQIAAGLRIPRGDVGTKGNVRHLRGHHRSQEWIRESDYCTNRSYTVQAGISEDQARHIAGIDITPGEWGTADNRRKVAAITTRLVAAMKAGELDEVLEVYGAAPDLTSVTGYNNRENRAASSDDSHLDHVHVGMDRRKLRDRAALARLVAVILGDDMTPAELLAVKLSNGLSLNNVLVTLYNRVPTDLVARFDKVLAAALDDDDTTVVVGPEALAELKAIHAELTALPELTADAVVAEQVERLAE